MEYLTKYNSGKDQNLLYFFLFYYCQLYYHFLYLLLISIFIIMVPVIIDLTFPNASELVNLSSPCPSPKMVPNSPIWSHSNLKCIAKLSKGWGYQLYFREGKVLPLENIIALFLISQFLHFCNRQLFQTFCLPMRKALIFLQAITFPNGAPPSLYAYFSDFAFKYLECKLHDPLWQMLVAKM